MHKGPRRYFWRAVYELHYSKPKKNRFNDTIGNVKKLFKRWGQK
jgi:hypothetical protein